jgi:MscS family membrane protein
MDNILEHRQLLKAGDIRGFSMGKQKYRPFYIRVANTPSSAGWMTRCGIALLASILIMALVVNPNQAAAADENTHPLEPLDTSSPRATLTNFLKTFDEAIQFYRNVYRNNPGRVNHSRFRSILSKAGRALDLSKVSEAARKQKGVDSIGLLYDILSKIELPPENTLPGAEAFADDTAQTPASWKIPHTGITIARIMQGPRAGEFLFTSETVERLEEFYERVRDLPVRRQVVLENIYKMRQMVGGWMIPPKVIDRMPGWLMIPIFGQALWKLFALTILITLVLIVLLPVFRWAHRGSQERSFGFYLRRLAVPASILLILPLAQYLAVEQINLTGAFEYGANIIAAAVSYLTLGWGIWLIALSVGEGIIASPRISDESLDAHLLRMAARVLGIIAFFILFLHGAGRVGVPLFGLITGAGVFGLAIALAAQDTLRNFLGSVMIFMDRPYAVGQRIVVEGHDGTVESIGLRSTKIRLLSGHLTTIPNEKMAATDIENIGRRSFIRRLFNVTITYDTPPEKIKRAQEILWDILAVPEDTATESRRSPGDMADTSAVGDAKKQQRHPNEAINQPDFPPRVYFNDLNADSLNILVIYWYHPPENWDYLEHATWINEQIIERFNAEGIDFAFPTQTIYHAGDEKRPLNLNQGSISEETVWSQAVSTRVEEAESKAIQAKPSISQSIRSNLKSTED